MYKTMYSCIISNILKTVIKIYKNILQKEHEIKKKRYKYKVYLKINIFQLLSHVCKRLVC